MIADRSKSTRSPRRLTARRNVRPDVELLEDRLAPAGALDLGFGTDGIVLVSHAPVTHWAAVDMVMQPDGKLVVSAKADNDAALLRFNADGSLDTTFGGGDGIVTFSSPDLYLVGGLALQEDKIILAGAAWAPGALTGATIVRCNPDGSLDPTFGGGDGIITFNPRRGQDGRVFQTMTPPVVAVRPDGDIITAGRWYTSFGYQEGLEVVEESWLWLARVATDGDISATIGAEGGVNSVTDIALRNDKILIAGSSVLHVPEGEGVLLRYNANGSSDQGFGTNGRTRLRGTRYAGGLALQPDGRIYVSASDKNNAATQHLIAVTDGGSVDRSYGENGQATTASSLNAVGVVLQADESALVLSSLGTVARFGPSGTLDSDFGAGGKTVTDVQSEASALVLHGNRLIVAGSSGGQVLLSAYRLTSSILARDDSAAVNEDASVVVDVLANDQGPDGQALVIHSFTQPRHGSVTQEGQRLRYTPAANYYGPDEFAYTAKDGLGDANIARVAVTVRPVNNPPVANPDFVTTQEGTATLISVLTNDNSGPEPFEVLAIDGFSRPAHGAVAFAETIANGLSWFRRRLHYIPEPGFIGTDTFTYILGDGNGGQALATVTVTVTAAPAPLHANDDVATVDGAPATIAVLANDRAAGGATLRIDSFTQPAHGTVTRDGEQLQYTPAAGYSGPDLFGYVAVDDQGHSDSAVVVVTIHPQPGGLDLAFNTGGITTAHGASVALGGAPGGSGMAQQPDGKVLVVAPPPDRAAGGLILIRFKANGAPDHSFFLDSDGTIVTPVTVDTSAYASAVAVDSDGRIIVAGTRRTGTLLDAVLVGYNSDGSLDPSFGDDGVVITDLSTNLDPKRVVLQADGKILIAGNSTVVRYQPDGSLDTSFDGDGIVRVNIGTRGDTTQELALLPDGKIVVAGSRDDAEFAVARYHPDGTLDTPFGGAGFVSTPLPPGGSTLQNVVGLLPQADGGLIVTGTYVAAGSPSWAVLRYRADGSLDTSYGEDGYASLPASSFGSARDAAQQADGTVIVVGGNSKVTLARFRSTGALDTRFGDNGVARLSAGTSSTGRAVEVLNDGRILVTGTIDVNFDPSFLLARFHGDGGDAYSPSSSVTELPAQSAPTSTVSWARSDYGGGATLFDVFVSVDYGAPTPFQTATAQTSATFTGEPGHTHAFYSVATDQFGQREPAPAAADASTTVPAQVTTTTTLTSNAPTSVYGDGLTVHAKVASADANIVPTGAVQFIVDGAPVAAPVTLVNGSARLVLSLSAGNHTLSATYRGAAPFFRDSAASQPLAQTVMPAPLTISAENKSMRYGAAVPELTLAFAGLVNGDSAASLDVAPRLTTTATAVSNVGAYPITVSDAADANYTIAFVAGTLTVTPAPLTITATNASKLYGAGLPGLGATYAGFVNGDSAANLDVDGRLATTATAASAVGTYAITVSDADDANYAITFVAGTLTVTPAPLTITAANASKLYGAAVPGLGSTYVGFVNGDSAFSLDVAPTVTTTATWASNVGAYPITVSGAVAANYTIAFVAGTLTVTPAPATIIVEAPAPSAPQPPAPPTPVTLPAPTVVLHLHVPAGIQVTGLVVSFRQVSLSGAPTTTIVTVRVRTTLGKLQLRAKGLKVTGHNTDRLTLTGSRPMVLRGLKAMSLRLTKPRARAKVTLSASSGRQIKTATILVSPASLTKPRGKKGERQVSN